MAELKTKPYIAKTPILLDGDTYAEGDPIELTDKQAAALGQAVEPAPEVKKAAK